MTLKIALIGSAPSSVALAPYDDPSWQVWACSPGARPHVRRCNAWFEMHKWEPDKPWFSPDYIAFMANLQVPVYMIERVPLIPGCTPYPKEEMVAKYGPYVFTSTLSWMFALAIEAGAEEIGLWGVDMSADEEIYTHQRAGCQSFIWECQKRGIRVIVPQQSDLMRPPPLYGYNELDPMHQKLLARGAELDQRIVQTQAQVQQLHNELMYLKGAREDVTYTLRTWVADRQAVDMTRWTAQVAKTEAPMFPLTGRPEETGAARAPEAAKSVQELINGLKPVKTNWASTPEIAMSNGLNG